MRKTARAIRAFNPIHSQFGGYVNKPIRYLIEDIMEKIRASHISFRFVILYLTLFIYITKQDTAKKHFQIELEN